MSPVQAAVETSTLGTGSGRSRDGMLLTAAEVKRQREDGRK